LNNPGLYTTPGAVNVCPTPLYGLKFVRATFKYGVDCYFAYSQTSINLQQDVNLPGNHSPQIYQSSLTDEIFVDRRQIKGPPPLRADESA
jgi:heavy metal efflux system protein